MNCINDTEREYFGKKWVFLGQILPSGKNNKTGGMRYESVDCVRGIASRV